MKNNFILRGSRKRSKSLSQINVTPFVDVMLVLLIRIYVRGDIDVSYGFVLVTIAKIKKSGFKKVALVAKLKEG